MLFTHGRRYWLASRLRLGALICLLALVTSPVASAQEPSAYLRYVRTIETARAGVPEPVGLTFSPVANAFLLPQASSTLQTAVDTAAIPLINLFEDPWAPPASRRRSPNR